MADFKNGVGSNLKLIRKSKDITQEELAEIIGIHPRQLSKIETGEHFPSCKTLEKACIALDISPKELFDFEFLVDETEAIMTGTDNITRFQAQKSKKSKVYELRSSIDNPSQKTKVCSDDLMAKTAKALNKPVFVEYFDEKKSSKIVVFYPDGKEKVIRSSVDVEAKQNINYVMNEFKKICKDKHATEYIKLAFAALKDDDSLRKLESVIYGMKLSRNMD
ncbi:MAG: helix-turn-helix transcriptional regulator [Clostridium sp.]|nr:helix-turn-helix transcriptional regulator [Clostridium sp.]